MRAGAFKAPQRREIQPGSRVTASSSIDAGGAAKERAALLSALERERAQGKQSGGSNSYDRSRSVGPSEDRRDTTPNGRIDIGRAKSLGLKRASAAPVSRSPSPPPTRARSHGRVRGSDDSDEDDRAGYSFRGRQASTRSKHASAYTDDDASSASSRSPSPPPVRKSTTSAARAAADRVRSMPPPAKAPVTRSPSPALPPRQPVPSPSRNTASTPPLGRNTVAPPASPPKDASNSKQEDSKAVPAPAAAAGWMGSLWAKTASVWTGATNEAEEAVKKDDESKNALEEQSKKEEEVEVKPLVNPALFASTKLAAQKAKDEAAAALEKEKKEAEKPALPEVEPITWHRPPAIHPRDFSRARTAAIPQESGSRTPFDWLHPSSGSALEFYLFHNPKATATRGRGRAKTIRGRGGGRPVMPMTRTDPGPIPSFLNGGPQGMPGDVRRFTLTDGPPPSNSHPHSVLPATQIPLQHPQTPYQQPFPHHQPFGPQFQGQPFLAPNPFPPPTPSSSPTYAPPKSAAPSYFPPQFQPPIGHQLPTSAPSPYNSAVQATFAQTVPPQPCSSVQASANASYPIGPNLWPSANAGPSPAPLGRTPPLPPTISSPGPSPAPPTPAQQAVASYQQGSGPQSIPSYLAIASSFSAQAQISAHVPNPALASPHPLFPPSQTSIASPPPLGVISTPCYVSGPAMLVAGQAVAPVLPSIAQVAVPIPQTSVPPLNADSCPADSNQLPPEVASVCDNQPQLVVTDHAQQSDPSPPYTSSALQDLPATILASASEAVMSAPATDASAVTSLPISMPAPPITPSLDTKSLPAIAVSTTDAIVASQAEIVLTPPTPSTMVGVNSFARSATPLVLTGDGSYDTSNQAGNETLGNEESEEEGEAEEEETIIDLPLQIELGWKLPEMGFGLGLGPSEEKASDFFSSLGGPSSAGLLKMEEDGHFPLPEAGSTPEDDEEDDFDEDEEEEDEAAETMIEQAFEDTTEFVRGFREADIAGISGAVSPDRNPGARMNRWLEDQGVAPAKPAGFAALPLENEEAIDDDDTDSMVMNTGQNLDPNKLAPGVYRPRVVPIKPNSSSTIISSAHPSALYKSLTLNPSPVIPHSRIHKTFNSHSRSLSLQDLPSQSNDGGPPSPTDADFDNEPVLSRARAVSVSEKSVVFGGSILSVKEEKDEVAGVLGKPTQSNIPRPVSAAPRLEIARVSEKDRHAKALAALSNDAFTTSSSNRSAPTAQLPGSVSNAKKEEPLMSSEMENLFANW